MKLVAATGGLGNQMFDYAFMVKLAQENKASLFHPYRDSSKRYGHAGFQLEEIFELRPSDKKKGLGVGLFAAYWHVTRLFPKKFTPVLLGLVGMHEVKVAENFIYYPEVFQPRGKNELFMGTWQSQRYFEGAEKEVREFFTFKETLLNEKTRQLAVKLSQRNSVSLHIRRDDYLSTQYAKGFGGICTIAYYASAIEYVKSKVVHPCFYVFSDDLDWCREHLDVTDAVFVDWNRDDESWQDMYLMSRCKHNIIANSTFSWWGAWLNTNPNKIVVAPDKWWNGLKDDVVPNEWMRINGGISL